MQLGRGGYQPTQGVAASVGDHSGIPPGLSSLKVLVPLSQMASRLSVSIFLGVCYLPISLPVTT